LLFVFVCHSLLLLPSLPPNHTRVIGPMVTHHSLVQWSQEIAVKNV
jgi:hypothetical protein